MILTEEEVYNGAKRWLRKNGFTILAGQPARGVDHLPVIEIKQPTGEKGSHYSYKPDLVAFKDGVFYIIECKPEFSESDLLKIQSVIDSEERINSFFFEMDQYALLRKVNYLGGISEFKNALEGILAFSGEPGYLCNCYRLIVQSWKGVGILLNKKQ